MNSSSRHRVTAPRRVHRRRSRPPTTTRPSLWKLGNGSKFHSSSAVSARKLAAGFWQPLPSGQASESSKGNNSGGEYRHFMPKSRSPHSKSLVDLSVAACSCDCGRSKASTEAKYYFYSRMKLIEDQVKSVSNTSTLQAQLLHAQLQSDKLAAELRSSRSQLKCLSRKLEEERFLWQRREHGRICAVVGALKNELRIERENRNRVEIINSELVKEIAEHKSSAKQLMRDYEEEKKAREGIEEVAKELAKRIDFDKAEFEALRRETEMIREQLEEERDMLQTAEAWREERVQMKLMDAKFALENKYSQMNMLISVLENFLALRSEESVNETEFMRKADVFREVARSVTIQDVDEQLAYSPPRDGNIYSIVEEVRKAEAYLDQPEPDGASSYEPVHVEVGTSDRSDHMQESSPDIIGNNDEKLQGAESMDVFRAKFRCPWPSEDVAMLGEGSKKVRSREVARDEALSPHRKSMEGDPKLQGSIVQRNSLELVSNPHIVQGMKGHVEWPKGLTRRSTKKSKTIKSGIKRHNN